MIERKHALIRMVILLLGVKPAELYYRLGGRHRNWEIMHLNRLEELITERCGKLYNACGEDAEEAIELLEELMSKIYEEHGSSEQALEKLLRKPMFCNDVKAKMSEKGFSPRDTDKAARALGVIKERRPTPKGKVKIWWSLPDDD